MVSPLTRTTGELSLDLTRKRGRGHVATRERPRYRRGLRAIAAANEARVRKHAVVNLFAHSFKLAFSQIMSGFGDEREGIWDEYDWERFLQQQDQRTEKYMELLEKYIDDPNRDEIIAREMGWARGTSDGDWTAEVDALLDEDWRVHEEDRERDQ